MSNDSNEVLLGKLQYQTQENYKLVHQLVANPHDHQIHHSFLASSDRLQKLRQEVLQKMK